MASRDVEPNTVEKLTYFWGLFDVPNAASAEAASKRARFDGSAIPEEVSRSFQAERIAELEGEFGLPGVAQPTEIDYLQYAVAGVTRTIRVFNRGVALFYSETPELLRLHRFFCILQEHDTQQ